MTEYDPKKKAHMRPQDGSHGGEDNVDISLQKEHRTQSTYDITREAEEAARSSQSNHAIRQVTSSSVFRYGMLLRLHMVEMNKDIDISPVREMVLGRRDPVHGIFPDIDLTPYAGYQLGLSRQHVKVRLKGSRLEIIDLGSRNGTYLNGERLEPNQPYKLRDGDEIRLGKVVFYAYFISEDEN